MYKIEIKNLSVIFLNQEYQTVLLFLILNSTQQFKIQFRNFKYKFYPFYLFEQPK